MAAISSFSSSSQVVIPSNEPQKLSPIQRVYWPEPFRDIMQGIKIISEEKFKEYAGILQIHREKGNYFKDAFDDTSRAEAIKKMYHLYTYLIGETDLVARAILLKTEFLQNLAQHDKCPLTDAQKEYVELTSLPGALKACNATEFLGIENYKNWLLAYRFGCIQPEDIAAQTKLYEGLCAEDRQKLREKRLEIANTCFTAFKAGEITKNQLEESLERMKLIAACDYSKIGKPLSNPVLQKAMEAHMELTRNYFFMNEEKYNAYWNAAISALNTMILSVKVV